MLFQSFLVACYATLHATYLSVHLSIFSSDVENKRSFRLSDWLAASVTASAHPHATNRMCDKFGKILERSF